MEYELAIAGRAYSSWSMRIGLLVDRYKLPITLRCAQLGSEGFRTLLAEFPPARTVPALKTDDGFIITESLAIAEELASRFPEDGLWPEDPAPRGVLRGLAAEMHTGFAALRAECPMNLRIAYSNFPVSEAVQADLQRLEAIWEHARRQLAAHVPSGPWLGGDYSIADAFFAPVAARIAGYGLPVSAQAQAYVSAHLSEPSFRRWREDGLTDGPDVPQYTFAYDRRPWPD